MQVNTCMSSNASAGPRRPWFAGALPLAVTAGVQSVFSFTIPPAAPLGAGTYIIEVAGDGNATGPYLMQLSSP